MEGKIIIPTTNYQGFPSPLPFFRKSIDLASISKVIKYTSEYGRPFITPRISLLGDRISIISKTSGNIQLSVNFYGETQIARLIQEIVEQNEGIQIIKG